VSSRSLIPVSLSNQPLSQHRLTWFRPPDSGYNTSTFSRSNTKFRFKYINQLDATTSQVYYLTFLYSSTCFGRPHAHHQELNNCSKSLWFYRWSVVIVVLLVVVGPASRPDQDQQPCYHHSPKVKPEAATAVVELLMMGMRTPETCWAVNKRQVINWRNFCI
jgi:hypothetical protein